MLNSHDRISRSLCLPHPATYLLLAALCVLFLTCLGQSPSRSSSRSPHEQPDGRWRKVHAMLGVRELTPVNVQGPSSMQPHRRDFMRFDLSRRTWALIGKGTQRKGEEAALWLAKDAVHESMASLEDIRREYAEVALIERERVRERERERERQREAKERQKGRAAGNLHLPFQMKTNRRQSQ